MQEYVESAKKTITSATKKVIRKSSEVYGITKLSLKISSIKNEIDDKYLEIGKIGYSNYKGEENSSEKFESLCNEIDALKEQIDTLSAELAALKNNAVCPVCGAEVSRDSTFCAACGEKIS